ncbi:BCCT family osmoprotectant transporter [Sporosarcina newyorkensis 2681]|uniref:BCCT family osmoprotectant transporter n=1 Tax=Sporosarcina newyorkensis 2681 TaxID=1027292 RepID=F9DXJ4_9BACL|nr:BCCT family transporter [Sporosarcina newyorkensis]EGQ20618.1 BCCT family osmoprotectant transporter [Sporosarcina newyorkensis 2681]
MHITKVFWYAVAICIAIVVWGVFAPDQLNGFTTSVTGVIYNQFGWFYTLVIIALIGFCIYMMFSRFRNVKLGKDDDEPDFSLPAWFAMLFSAGMGIGLMFFTTAETISHAFIKSPNAEPGSEQAILESLQYTSLHWGFHGWGLYAVVALIFAYFKFRVGAPGLISATMEPLFGKKAMRGPVGQVIDTLAIFATVAGVASTLGFGSAQINSGLTYLFNAPDAFWFQLLILIVATVVFIASAWSGIGNGIKYLSSINLWLAVILLLGLFTVGPTTYIINMFVTTIGNYAGNFIQMSFDLKPVNESQRGWVNDWTIFYWAWWISWAPFVGMFIARVSKGRTIREFIIGVLIAPTLVTFIFFAVFGGSALNLEQHGIAKLSSLATETVTFGMFEHYPLGAILSFLTIIVVAIFFITSADSATFVLGMFSTGGQLNPSNIVKIAWGLLLSAMAAIVMYSGGLDGFQNMLIIAALPFSIILILMVVSFYKTIKKIED